MRLTMLASVALLLCLAPSVRVVAADKVYENTEFGFKIDNPEEWTFSEPSPPDDILFSVKLAKVKNNTETSVTIHIAERGNDVNNSNEVRDAVEQLWKRDEQLSNIKRGKARYAGQDAQWLKGTYDTGTRYTLRQNFLVTEDYIYVLQELAPEKEFKDAEKTFEPLLKSFHFIEIDEDRTRLMELADYCGSEIKFAGSWQQAATRAQEQDRLVLVIFEVYRGVIEGRFSDRSLFMHPDIVEIVNERFVPWFWEPGSGAPFDDPREFGLGPSTFGNGIMFATAAGRIVGQTTTLDPYHVYDRCREVLKEHPGAPAENDKNPKELLRRGELEVVAELLVEPIGKDAWALAYELHRKLRNGEEALNACEQMEGSDFDEALIHVHMGEFAKAEKLLARSKEPQDMFFHCVAVAQQKGFDAVKDKLRELALGHPANRWAWLAAAVLTEERLIGVLDMATWPEQAQVDAWSIPKYEIETDLEKARRGALDYLLLKQDSDGKWINPRSNRSGLFDVAIASICGTSLLPHKEEVLVQAALDKANEFIVESDLKLDPELLFDYTIWAEIFALDFLARCNEHGIGDRGKNSKAMKALIKDLEANQYPGGGWGYFHSADIPDNTIGFVTAPAILALQRANENGAKVPPRMLEKALKSIEVLHHEGGTFGYMWATGPTKPGREAEASLRSPLYALALNRGEKGDKDVIRKALDAYVRFHDHTIKERGKTVCHTGPEATAAYYLLFGYRFAAEAVLELPEKEQEKYRKVLLKDVQQYRLEDGSFCDYLSVGREYGAGMALTTLDLLIPAKE